jgi:hypothetical protein
MNCSSPSRSATSRLRAGDAGQERPGQGRAHRAGSRGRARRQRGDADPNSAGQLARREAALDFQSDDDTHHHSHHAPDLDAGRDDDADLGL